VIENMKLHDIKISPVQAMAQNTRASRPCRLS